MIKIDKNCHLILASGSPVRKKMLKSLGLSFEVVIPEFDEEQAKTGIANLSMKNQSLYLARGKALSISKKYPKSIVIAADQICELHKKPINKSNDRNQAIDQLQKLSGNVHYQNNATVIYQNGQELLGFFEKIELKMHKLSKEEIASYVNLDEPWGCAGSYKFESFGRYLFADFKGNQDCILGMNLQPILNFLYQNKLISI